MQPTPFIKEVVQLLPHTHGAGILRNYLWFVDLLVNLSS